MQLNPDLPISVQLPGVYVYLNLIGAAPAPAPTRVLFLGYKTSSGVANAGTLKRLNSEEEVISEYGTGSPLHRMFRTFVAQGGAKTGAELYAMPLNAPSGSAQTKFIKVLESPTGAVVGSSGTAASAAGYWTVWIAGKQFDSVISNGDTYATVMQNMVSQIQADQDFLPCTAAYSGGQIVLTSRVAALVGADFPVAVKFSSSAMLLSASPGTMTFGGAASGGGTSKISNYQDWSASATIVNLDAATASSTGLVTAINASTATPIKAAEPNPKTGAITLYYVPERPLNFLAGSITAGITQTLTPSIGTSASGLPSASTPALGTILDSLKTSNVFRLWVTDFTGQGGYVTDASLSQFGSATSYADMGTLASHLIDQNGGGMGQGKGQNLIWGYTSGLAYAGAVHTGTTPNLTITPLTFPLWCRSSPMPALDLAARAAAIICAKIDYPPFNYAGQVFVTDSRTPMMLPHEAVRASDSDTNAALASYFLSPVRVNGNGQLEIVSGRTSAKPSASIDRGYAFWGFQLTDQAVRDRLLATMGQVISGKNLKLYGASVSDFTVTTEAIQTAVGTEMAQMDALGWIDGSDGLLSAIEVRRNMAAPARVDIKMPKRFPYPVEQLSIVAQLEG